MTNSHNRLQNQVERIVDTGEGRYRRIIVQMHGCSELEEGCLEGAMRALRRRRMVVSARELLPANADSFHRGRDLKLTAAQARRQRQAEASIASQIAAANARQPARKPSHRQLVAAAERALRPLDRSAVMQKISGRRSGAAAAHRFWSSGAMALEVTPDELQTLVREVDDIADIFPDRELRVPPISKVQRLPHNVADAKASSWGVNATGALATWGAYGARGSGLTVGVLDTGVDAQHPDLQGKVSAFAEFEQNGDEVPGATVRDDGEHGTHVCGTVAGGNDSGEWIGCAPDAQLAVGMVLRGGFGTDAQILAGMEWAIAQDVDVISMSLGGLSFDPNVLDTYTRTMLTAAQVGIPVVAAIGNDGDQTSGSPGNDFFALAVGATDLEDEAAGFSAGRTQVIRDSAFINPDFLPLVFSKPDISAPGVAVRSAVPGGGYETWNGTSMATPHVAGAVALLLGATDLRDEVPTTELAFVLRDLLTGSVEELGEAGQDHRYGYGRLDVLRAVGMAREAGF